jgi:hypothetical protein
MDVETHIKRAFRLGLKALLLSSFILHPSSFAATVTGTLRDIQVGALAAQLTFAPTNAVIVSGSGLNIGPAKTFWCGTNMVSTNLVTNGVFSIALDAGRYTVSAPAYSAWRKSFTIEVPTGTNSYDITNLITAGAVQVTYTGMRLLYEENGTAAGYLQFDP